MRLRVECQHCGEIVGTYDDGERRLETHGHPDAPCPWSRMSVMENQEAFEVDDVEIACTD